ncbi:hypothetical protein B0J18DRAFT_223647 [Chaetomium sp. MPI-SDFR-AT-0129]|nr:hypothetical protein B0J18DRAFT_223647 [Chaetomium sp. MPI-SDFR-AT-0129]
MIPRGMHPRLSFFYLALISSQSVSQSVTRQAGFPLPLLCHTTELGPGPVRSGNTIHLDTCWVSVLCMHTPSFCMDSLTTRCIFLFFVFFLHLKQYNRRGWEHGVC